MNRNNCSVSEYNNKMLNELYSLSTLVNVTKIYCQELEFSGQYYGADNASIKKLSTERNEYLTMLNLIRGKVDDIINFNLNIESRQL